MTEPVEDADRFVLSAREVAVEPKAKRSRAGSKAAEMLPPNLGESVVVKTPDFSDPNRAKTCLEVDFPIVPINALSAQEGNAGKPIYQMSKWWARRRGSVFRAMLIAAATEAPARKNPDGSPVLDDQGRPVPDETEAAKVVWDAYYANHQAAGNFRHLRILDPFMGGGTTLVEGSRLGFEVSGVDLNPVAWFVVKNELAGTDPAEVHRLFERVEAEVKPRVQPYYATECPRGHRGVWADVRSGQPATIDPATLPPQERAQYRYRGPEVIYTFWAKHGPCRHPECGHRTPVFRTPVIAEKKLGVKYFDLTCKRCKLAFHAELGSARMAPGAERTILGNEGPFTELSQPFASRLIDYSKGGKGDKTLRVAELCDMVEEEPGLRCPACGAFAGQWLRDILKMHRGASRVSDIDKKHLRILPERNSIKPVYCYLLVHPDWLMGAPSKAAGQDLGGYADASLAATSAWYAERLRNLSLIEVRGRIKLSDDPSLATTGGDEPAEASENGIAGQGNGSDDVQAEDDDASDRKKFGLPRFLTLADGRKIDTRKATLKSKATLTCQGCGHPSGIIDSLREAKQSAATAPYALQAFCPQCKAEGHIYEGRYFLAPSPLDVSRLVAALTEWEAARSTSLADFWPNQVIPYGWQTHFWSIPDHGYTHWHRFFNGRQLLVHSLLLRTVLTTDAVDQEIREQALGAIQQYLRNNCMFAFWDIQYDKLVPHFSNNNYVAKQLVVENCVFPKLGRGNWTSCTEGVVEGLTWYSQPWEPHLTELDATAPSEKVYPGDPVQGDRATIACGSSSDLISLDDKSFDLVITDPPFGDNFIYSELANFFLAWLRLPLSQWYPDVFSLPHSPYSQEAVKNVAHHPEDADVFYKEMLTACWTESIRVLKDGGLLAFTFHHSKDEQWSLVLESLFASGLILVATYPITSDETKGENSEFGSKKIEYDIIHVCRKRLDDPRPVSWPKMRQWVRAELGRLRRLLESYRARDLSDADVRVILRGKALEFYSRHYGQVFTGEGEPLSIRHALLGINQLLDEASSTPEERPPGIVQPVAYQFLQLFGGRAALPRDEVGKSLRGTGISQREFELRGWTREESKTVHRVPIPDRFEALRRRPRKEMQTEVDQAHFLIGSAMPGSGVNIEQELDKDTWMVKRTVEAVLGWYAKTAPEPETRRAAALSLTLLRQAIERRRATTAQEQGLLFDDLDLEDDL